MLLSFDVKSLHNKRDQIDLFRLLNYLIKGFYSFRKASWHFELCIIIE